MTTRSRRPKAPSYLRHRPSDRAYTYIREDGNRRCVFLGPWDSPESFRE